MVLGFLGNPILNEPYNAPDRHFGLGPSGPTGEILHDRRLSESIIRVRPLKTGKDEGQQALKRALKADIDEGAWGCIQR